MKDTQLNNPQFSKLVEQFKRELEKEEKSETYAYQHESNVKEFLQFLEKKDVKSIKEVTQEMAEDYVSYLEKRINIRRGGTLSQQTINKQKGGINRFWKFLELERHNVNPIYLRYKKREQEMPDVYSQQEIQWLYSVTDDSAIGYRDRCMLALFYGCGLRRSEGMEIVLQDIDFGKGRVLIRDPKNGRDRYVMFSPKVQQMIEAYVYQARDLYLPEGAQYDNLFISERGAPIQYETAKARMTSLAKRVQNRYETERLLNGIHALRHSLGTHLHMAGMDVDKIAFMLGHRTLESTQLYIHSANDLKS